MNSGGVHMLVFSIKSKMQVNRKRSVQATLFPRIVLCGACSYLSEGFSHPEINLLGSHCLHGTLKPTLCDAHKVLIFQPLTPNFPPALRQHSAASFNQLPGQQYCTLLLHQTRHHFVLRMIVNATKHKKLLLYSK